MMFSLIRDVGLDFFNCDWLTENAPYPDCHWNLNFVFWFLLIQRDELAFIIWMVDEIENWGWIFRSK
jgi:hypothetical protein